MFDFHFFWEVLVVGVFVWILELGGLFIFVIIDWRWFCVLTVWFRVLGFFRLRFLLGICFQVTSL